jgi:hypothetical protein
VIIAIYGWNNDSVLSCSHQFRIHHDASHAPVTVREGVNFRDQEHHEHGTMQRAGQTSVIDNYHNVQQDILETFIDRGQLRKLAEPTVLPNGKRIPGLKLEHPRQLALMHALVRFSHIAALNTFATSEIYADTLGALAVAPKDYGLASLRYDLSKLRAKGLVEKVPRSRRLMAEGPCGGAESHQAERCRACDRRSETRNHPELAGSPALCGPK